MENTVPIIQMSSSMSGGVKRDGEELKGRNKRPGMRIGTFSKKQRKPVGQKAVLRE